MTKVMMVNRTVMRTKRIVFVVSVQLNFRTFLRNVASGSHVSVLIPKVPVFVVCVLYFFSESKVRYLYSKVKI
jgi:hypothetical protein